MRIKSIPMFIIGFVNIALVLILLVLVILGIRPVSTLPSSLICLITGIWALTSGIETKKQRQQKIERLEALARLYGWDKEVEPDDSRKTRKAKPDSSKN